jgi:hypothetical protein
LEARRKFRYVSESNALEHKLEIHVAFPWVGLGGPVQISCIDISNSVLFLL